MHSETLTLAKKTTDINLIGLCVGLTLNKQ